jgi:hypothetical protein
VPAVVRWLEEHRLPELVVAAVAGDQDVTHATAAPGSVAGRFTQARLPAHLRLAGPQLVTEWAAFRLILEHRDGHLNDHALTGSYASTITMTSTQRPLQVNGVPLPRPQRRDENTNLAGPRLSSLGRVSTLAPWAEHLTEALLRESLPRRWAHVQGVAARPRGLATVLGTDGDLLEAAAWLHDIGYAPDLAITGLHALDGARYLRDARHADEMLCRLVAYHSCAIVEAEERGLADVLSLEFEPAPHVLSSVLTYCDMTTSPDGELVPLESGSPRYTIPTAQSTW